jgi:hypothetical protein
MSLLKEIQKTLKDLAKDSEIPMQDAYYGMCRAQDLREWNYFVFNRVKTSKSSNKIDRQTFYQVHIVHEDYIPEGYIEKVIEELETQKAGAKLKQTSDDITYNYIFKGKTNLVVEIASITFYHPEKRH